MSIQLSGIRNLVCIAVLASASCVVETEGEGEGDAETLTTESTVLSASNMGTMFITRAELESKPTSGAGWTFLKSKADMSSWGTVNLADQNALTQSYVLAGALVYARTGITSYRDKVIEYVKRAPGTEIDGTDQLLNLARTLYGYVVAADLVGMPLSTVCNNGQTWGQYLQGIRQTAIPGNSRWPTLEKTSADSASNWGAYALSTHLAVSYALNDTAAIQRDINIFKRYLGDTTSPAAAFNPTSAYVHNNHGATWDMSPTMQRGINPASATNDRAGAIVEDVMRSYDVPSIACCKPEVAGILYSEEAMDGFFSTMQLLRAHGVDLTRAQDSAAKRAYHYMVTHGGPGPYTVTRYLPYFVNYHYGTSYPVQTEDRPYRHLGYGSWLFTGAPKITPDDTTPPPPTTTTPMVVGSSSNPGGMLTALAIARPTTAASGDLMLASVMYRGSGAIGAPTGWSVVRDTFNGGTHMATFVKRAGTAEPSTYVFNVPSASGLCGGITAWRGVTAVDVSSGASGPGTAAVAPSLTTTGSHRGLVAVYGQINRTAYTPPAGMTEQFDVTTPSGTYLGTNAQAVGMQATAGATGSRTATAAGAGGGWIAQLIALR